MTETTTAVRYADFNAAKMTNPLLARGSRIEIWYTRDHEAGAQDWRMGYEWLVTESNVTLPNDIHELGRSHTRIGRCQGARTQMKPSAEAEQIFMAMQGECWSPNGEAREWIEQNGTLHTSMSTGDVVIIDGVAWMVNNAGFEKLFSSAFEGTRAGLRNLETECNRLADLAGATRYLFACGDVIADQQTLEDIAKARECIDRLRDTIESLGD